MKKINMDVLLLTSVLCLVPILFGLYCYQGLPERIAIHFDINNNPDGFMSRELFMFGVPAIMMGIQIFMCIMLDLKNKHVDMKNKSLFMYKLIIPFISVILYVILILYAMSFGLDISKVASVILGVVFIICNGNKSSLDKKKTYYADIKIENYGTITVKLDPTNAPRTCENFVELANNKFYDGLTFHRIMAGFMMQGGDPDGDGTGGSDKNIVGEFASNGYNNPLSHTRGAISMARSGDPNSASSQFFIVHQNSTFLDGEYAVFGYVTEGMGIVDRVCEEAKPIDNNGTIIAPQQPVISSVTIRTE